MSGTGGQSVASLVEPPSNPTAGDLQTAAGDIDGFLSEVTGAIEDPLSMVVGTGVDFVLNYVQPVQDALHLVTGDGPALEKSAAQFTELKSACDALAKELAETFDDQLGQWEGDASDAARKKIAQFVEGVRDTGMLGHNLSELLRMSAVFMEAAEEVIKGVLADFLTWAITTWIIAMASAWVTAGGSTATAAAATSVEAGVTCSRAAQQVQRIVKVINTINTVIENVKAVIDTVRIADAMDTIRSGTGNESSGDELSAAKDVATQAGELNSQAKDDVTSVAEAAGIDPEPEPGSGSGSTDGSTGETNGGPERPTLTGSVAEHGREQLGEAADSLQEQAKEGGFSHVPSDRTISGRLDV